MSGIYSVLAGSKTTGTPTGPAGYYWTVRTSGASTELFCIGRNGVNTVIGSSNGINLTSSDDTAWTSRNGLTTTTWATNVMYGVTYGNSRFLAVGGASTGGSGKGASSTDNGVTWTVQTSLSTAVSNNRIRCVIWTGTQFVAGSDAGYIATSPDGVTWTQRAGLRGLSWGVQSVRRLAWNGSNQIFAIGPTGASSPDGITWTIQAGLATALTASFPPSSGDIVWSGTRYLVCSTNGKLATSVDGVTWTARTAPNTNAYFAAAWTGANFVIGGQSGNIATSPDTATWTLRTNLSLTTWGINQVDALNWGNSVLTASGPLGLVATSVAG